ncbi:uncharacterized protein LOC131326378 [Rhododendron vialii]|uniref:uncharacterized protein LOC131326378 n=1 Tax=Rhododendron vialii TaxID=182163 RepID=UPI0026602577|nr:uncharacterized protein LOC131326378 [Rhododendron vialii]
MKKRGGHGYFPDDCWELIFQKLREDDERDLDSISLVSKRFLSISNRMKLSLNVNDETIPLLPNLLRRFRHIETIVIKTHAHKEIDGLVYYPIARSFMDGLVDYPIARSIIDGLVDDELVDDQIAWSDIDGLVDDQIAQSDIDGLVDDQIARSNIDGLVDDQIAQSDIDGLVDDQIARSDIDGLVDDQIAQLNIDGLVDDELVDDQIAWSDIDGLVDDELVDGQIAQSDIDGLVDNQIAQSDIDGLVDDQIARSGLLNLRAIKFWCSTVPPRDGFRALALHRNIKNNLKVLDCSGLISMQDSDLVLIADCFPRLEELKISEDSDMVNGEVAARITDDGVEALASKLKELKKIVVKGEACFITDKSLISLSTNCAKLRRLSLGINLHSLTSQKLISDKRIIYLVAKARPPLKKVKLVGLGGQYPKTHGAVKLFFQTCQSTLKELTLRGWPLTHISDFARYLSNLTSIDLDGCFGLTGDTFYILMKSCPLVEILTMAHTIRQEMDTFSQDYLHKNYSMRHLNISKNMWLTDTTLENFGQVCPNLQFLSINGCPRLTNLGIGEVLKRCPAITQLNIDGLTQVSDFLRRNSDNSVVNLKTLNARGTHINDEGLAMIGNRCRNLQYLDIGLCKEVTDKGVMEVVTNCQRLRDINLIGCEKLSTYSYILPHGVFNAPPLGTSSHQVGRPLRSGQPFVSSPIDFEFDEILTW